LAFSFSIGVPFAAFQPRPVHAYLCCALAVAVGVLLAVATGSGQAASETPAGSIGLLLPPPKPPPFVLRDISPSAAVTVNARIPFSTDPNFSAKPFQFRGDKETRERALECLTLAVYYEAGNQDATSQQAVAQVVLNRVRHPAFPQSICGVVFQGHERRTGCQFTFTCDGSLLRPPAPLSWMRSRQVAEAALDGAVFGAVGLATHYHANYVVPYWATSLQKNAQVGLHIFYRWQKPWGLPAAFARKYAAAEAYPADLASAAILQGNSWYKAGVAPDRTIRFTVDPRTELLSVVQHLADANGGSPSPSGGYEKDIESFFAPEKDHVAIRMFAKLSKADPQFPAKAAEFLLGYSLPPELAAVAGPSEAARSPSDDKHLVIFVDALRYFARSSEFGRFFAGHKQFYSRAVDLAEQRGGIARAYWQAYTRTALPPTSLIVTTVEIHSPASCTATQANSLPGIVPLAAFTGSNDADIFLAVERAAPANADVSPAIEPMADEQIIRAVFVRVAALTSGESADPGLDPRKLRSDSLLAPLDIRLRDYESRRNRLPTWSEFTADLSPAELRAEGSPPPGHLGSCESLAMASPQAGAGLNSK
jgi:cell wall hydrolase